MMRAFLAIAGVMLLICLLGAHPWVTIIGLPVVLAGCWWLGGHRLGMSIRRRLISDAERQHAALMRGDDVAGIYGRYPPPEWKMKITDGPLRDPLKLHPEWK